MHPEYPLGGGRFYEVPIQTGDGPAVSKWLAGGNVTHLLCVFKFEYCYNNQQNVSPSDLPLLLLTNKVWFELNNNQ